MEMTEIGIMLAGLLVAGLVLWLAATLMRRTIERSGHTTTEQAAVRTWPFYHLVAGDLEAALTALARAEAELARNGDPLFFAQYIRGRLLNSPAGDEIARSAVEALRETGVGNVRRALAMFGGEEVDRLFGPLGDR